MQCFAGLEHLISRFLAQNGHTVQLTGDRPTKLDNPDWKRLANHRTADRQLLRFVQHQERGLIWYRPEKVDLAWLITQIAFAWAKERIIVVATRQADAHTLWKGIRRYVSGVSLATTHHHPTNAGRIVIVTPGGLKQIGVQAEKRTLCICLNPTEALNDTDWLPVLKTRLYGLMCEDWVISPQQMELVAALFGSERVFIPRHGFRELPVSVKFLPFYAGSKTRPPRADSDESTHEVKRHHVWHDSLRNRLIAGLARALVHHDDKAMVNKYPCVAKDLLPRAGGRVAILVENVEHAAQLLKRLAGWPIVAGTVSNPDKLGTKVKAALVAGNQASHQKCSDVIVTTSTFAKVGSIDVLIRADAGTGLPPISSDFFVARDGVPSSLTIVDMNDRHHPHLRRRSTWRRTAYLERGWEVDGERMVRNPDAPFDYPPSYAHLDRPQITAISYLPGTRRKQTVSAATQAYEHRQKKRQRQEQQGQKRVTLKQIADHEFLIDCFKQLRSNGGWGPGEDDVTFSSLSPSEWARAFRKLSRALLKSRYRPQRARKVPIPKPGTTERRILTIRSICDRVVALALYRTLEPHFDKLFLPASWGFRPERGTWQMLADLKRTVEESGRWILAIDDVRKAFDNVQVEHLVEAHQKATQELRQTGNAAPVKISQAVLKLIAAIAGGTTDQRTRGIDQGSNYSPTALNVLLHYVHDLPLTAQVKHPCWYRYADNLVYPCQHEAEGQQMLRKVQALLRQAKLRLKGDGGTTDLRKEPAKLLGFQLRERAGKVVFSLADSAWENLKDHLADAHNATDPAHVAHGVIMGWINAYGPAFENDGEVVAKVYKIATEYGFREIIPEVIGRAVKQTWKQWTVILKHQGAQVALLSSRTPSLTA